MMPSCETLEMALSTANEEMIRLVWERLPQEHAENLELLLLAADFHREDALGWSFRDATEVGQEAFVEQAQEGPLVTHLPGLNTHHSPPTTDDPTPRPKFNHRPRGGLGAVRQCLRS
jgi:hypothetical protein